MRLKRDHKDTGLLGPRSFALGVISIALSSPGRGVISRGGKILCIYPPRVPKYDLQSYMKYIFTLLHIPIYLHMYLSVRVYTRSLN